MFKREGKKMKIIINRPHITLKVMCIQIVSALSFNGQDLTACLQYLSILSQKPKGYGDFTYKFRIFLLR